MNNKTKGAIGENIACKYLEEKGYRILEKNYRYSRMSEIDLIAIDKDTLVFVEVKTRSTENCGHPFEAVDSKKIEHIYQTALFYLQQTEHQYTKYRIDVISVINLQSPKIEHLKNISIN